MKIRADEHVATAIIRAVRDIALSPGWELTHVVEEGQKGTKDEYWITQFAKNGGDAIVSADTDFFKKPNQVIAIQRTGLKIIHLPSKWQNARCHFQAAHILFWWEKIEEKIKQCEKRECWQIPWEFKPAGQLSRKTLNLQEAEKKLKKQRR